ncbi:MAG: PAS domain-containing protein [Planctomycetota bacterium]|nr:PAS domain-containing protein [Planctomycetota bacterium]
MSASELLTTLAIGLVVGGVGGSAIAGWRRRRHQLRRERAAATFEPPPRDRPSTIMSLNPEGRLLKAIPDLLFRLDRHGRYIQYHAPNPAELLVPPEEFLGKTAREILPLTVAEPTERALAALFATGQPQTFEYQWTRDGETRHWEVRLAPSGHDEALAVVRNVTDARATQRRLRDTLEKLDLFFRRAPIAVIVWSREFHVLEWNPGAKRIFGWGPDEAIGKHVRMIVAPNHREMVDEVCSRLIAAKGGERSTNQNVTKDGRTIWCEWYNAPLLDDAGGVTAIVSLAEDITQRQEAQSQQARLQEQLRRTQQLESLGVLAGGIAHDFNNLLTGIIGNIELAIREGERAGEPAGEGAPPAGQASAGGAGRRALAQALVASRRAADLTRNMLVYAGQGQLETADVDVADLVREMIDLAGPSLRRNARVGVTNLKPELQGDSPARLITRGDRVQLTQILLNLLTNAGESIHTPGGEITVSCGVVDVDASELQSMLFHSGASAGRMIEVQVRDTGVGMDVKTQSRMFEPFFTTKGPGRGLGLAVATGIVRGHRGALDVRSKPGAGTSVRLLLPLVERLEETAPPADPVDAASGTTAQEAGVRAKAGAPLARRATVLVIDDEAVVLRVMDMALRKAGHEVHAFSDGRQALEAVASGKLRPEVAVVDRTMPEMSGLEVIRRLREFMPDLPALVVSGYAAEGASVGDESAITLPLGKPFGVTQLTEAIAELIDLRRQS